MEPYEPQPKQKLDPGDYGPDNPMPGSLMAQAAVEYAKEMAALTGCSLRQLLAGHLKKLENNHA